MEFQEIKNFFVASDLSATARLGGYCLCNKGKLKRNSTLEGFHCQISQDLFSLYFTSQVNKFSLRQFFFLSLWENQELKGLEVYLT